MKYGHNCLPGDCANATSFFTAGAQPQQVRNGNGDGRINGWLDSGNPFNDPWWPGNNASAEWNAVFDHLAAANLVPLSQYDETTIASVAAGVGFPKMKIADGANYQGLSMEGGFGVGYDIAHQYLTTGHKIRVGICTGTNPPYPSFGCGMLPPSAYAIDAKIDDGKPYSGTAMLASPTVYVYRVAGTAEDNTFLCGTFASNSYDLGDTVGGCALSINAGF